MTRQLSEEKMCVCVYVCVYMCVCVCVDDPERGLWNWSGFLRK